MGIKLCFFLCLIGLGTVEAGKMQPSSGYFNVKKFGASGNGRTDDTKAFHAAWDAACSSTGSVKLQIPQGTYLVGPLLFRGPCRNVPSLTVQLQGTLRATTNLNQYKDGGEWVLFGWIDGLTLTGGGTFDGQGSLAWPHNKCPMNQKCRLLPSSVKFHALKNTIVQGISSLNSKQFHIAITNCENFKASGLKITAPDSSPTTDGIHLEGSTGVDISSSAIGTGDDCISIGQGNSQVTIKSITCGPGHGISVGSLGKYENEGDVRGLIVKDCTFSNTMNGVRIKTWQNSPGVSTAANMSFENIVMNNVGNPIIIDQHYCPYSSCPDTVPSKVKLSNISFKNIRGTSASQLAVSLHCSKGSPCNGISLHNVHLDYHPGKAQSSCLNVKATYSGTQIPPPCH